MVKLIDLSEGPHIERELMLIKVKASGAQREEIKRTTDIFRGQIVDVTPNVYTIQLAGTTDKLQAFIDFTEPFKDEPAFKRIIEMAKTQIAAKIALLADQKAKVVALFETI